MTAPTIRIATRKSRLALWQAEHVAALLRDVDPELDVQLVHTSTVGDRDQDSSLAGFGGTGVFTREVQRVVLDDEADLAVHSLKDLPTAIVDGLALAGVPARGPVRDVLVWPGETEPGETLDALPEAARIGTGSLRRQAQLRHHRPDLVVEGVRGNVETRLRKLDEGEFDALVLAEAGLHRLGFDDRIGLPLGPPVMLHAVSQGALGLECRRDDDRTVSLLAALTDTVTHHAVLAERALLAELRAGCHAPVGVASAVGEDGHELTAVVLSADGRERIEASATSTDDEPVDLGCRVAHELLEQGAAELIAPPDSLRED